MSLDVECLGGVNSDGRVNLPHQSGLGVWIGKRNPACPTVLIEGRVENDGVDRIAVLDGMLEQF